MSPHRSTAILLASLLLISALVGGCAPPQPTRLGKISVEPSTILAGGTATLTVDAQGTDLKFKWTATRGRLSSSNTPSVLYTAPDAPGSDTVTVEVSGKGGTTVQNITLQVIKPTPVATATRTPIPTRVVPSPIPSPTRTPQPLAWIVSPTSGYRVAQFTTVTGGYRDDLQDELWVFVQNGYDGQYYPQANNPCKRESTFKQNGKWQVHATIGGDADQNKPFNLLLTTANVAAHKFLTDQMQAWCESKSFPGFKELPPGLTVIQRNSFIRSTERGERAPSISNTTLPGRAYFANMTNGMRATQEMTAVGTYPSSTQDNIWVLVYSTAGRWYPQSIDPCGEHTRQADGRWQTKVILGGDSEQPEPFDVVLILANPTASQFLSDIQREGCKMGDFPGLFTLQIPQGIMEMDRIRVTRLSKAITLLKAGNVSNWTTYSNGASTLTTQTAPGKSGKALAISYTLQPDGWIGVAAPITPSLWSEAAKVGFTYRGEGAPNTIELKFIYRSGAVFSVNTSPTATATSDWTSFEAWVSDLACWKGTPGCLRGDEKFDWSQVDRIDFAVSNKPGGKSGSGSVVIDEVYIIK